MPFQLRIVVTSAAALLCVSNAPALANAESTHLEEYLQLSLEDLVKVKVSVASQFLESKLQAGSSVDLITAEDWEKRGARRLHDAIGHLPSTMVLPNWFGADNITIRGYASSNNISGVATLWDGVPLNTLQSGGAQFDRQNIGLGTLDRIEMIRGPGSALYGQDAFHGVFSLHSFESLVDVSRISGEAASNGYYSGAIKHSQGVARGDRLNFAAAMAGQPDQDLQYSYSDSGTGASATAEREYTYQSMTASLKWVSNPDKDVFYRAGLYWDDNDSDDFLSQGSDDLNDRDVGGSESEFYMTQFALGHKLRHNAEIEFNGFYWEKDHVFDRALTNNRTLKATGGEYQWGADIVFRQAELFGHTQWSAKVGARYAEIGEAKQQNLDSAGNVVSDRVLPFSHLDREVYSLALDAATAFAAGKAELRYGARVDDYSDFGTQTSPRLGVVYFTQPDTAIKLLYGNAYRAPIGVELAGSATIDGDPNIKPETIDTYELAVVREAPTWRGELVYFQSHWKDAIEVVSTTTPGFVGQFANVGHSDAHGVEGSFATQFDKWLWDTSASYVESSNELTDTDYVAFPKFILNVGIGYVFSPSTRVFVANRVHLDAKEGVSATAPGLKDYWRTDVNVTHELKDRWTVFFNVRNLFGRDNYYPSLQDAEGGIPDEESSISVGARYLI